MKTRYFLVEFDGQTLPAKLTEFADRDSALEALRVLEPLEPVGGETVLLLAESEAALRVTHPGYFEDPFEGLRRTAREKSREIAGRSRAASAATP